MSNIECRHPLINRQAIGLAFVGPKTAKLVFVEKKTIFETPVVVDPKMKEGEIHFIRPNSPCKVYRI